MVDRPFFGGAVYTYIHIYIVIRADNTLLQSPPPPIFSRGRGRATRARASLSDFLPSALLPLFHIIYIRVAVPLTSSPLGIPIRKRICAAIRAISAVLARGTRCECRDEADRCWTEQPLIRKGTNAEGHSAPSQRGGCRLIVF